MRFASLRRNGSTRNECACALSLQEVEYVKQEAKIVYLLECLQKTAPPVLIFCESKQDVDDIHEYLMLKVRASSVHRFAVSR